MRNARSFGLILFLLGLFSETQVHVIGSIGISELFIYIAAPFMFMMDYYDLRRNGFMPVIILAIMSCVGCVISSIHNGTESRSLYRGLASAYSLFAIPVVLHHFLWRNLNGLKWVLLGWSISAILTIFVFTGAAEAAVVGRQMGGDVSSGELYYLSHFGPLSSVPLNCFYMRFPLLPALTLYSLPTVYTLFTTSTGRSAIMSLLMTALMVLFVGRDISKMVALKRRIYFFLAIALGAALLLGMAYKYFAMHDYLTDAAKDKYTEQTKRGTGFLSILMGGRSEFFIGLSAAFDEPIFGHGPWPVDKKGYSDEFVRKYGADEDYRRRLDWEAYVARVYGRSIQRMIPCHSMIVGNWLFYGILGLPFWFYILLKMFELMRKHLDAVPQWYGYFAVMFPSTFWNVFFSGYGARMSTCLFITVILLACAVGKGRLRLTEMMIAEIMQNRK